MQFENVFRNWRFRFNTQSGNVILTSLCIFLWLKNTIKYNNAPAFCHTLHLHRHSTENSICQFSHQIELIQRVIGLVLMTPPSLRWSISFTSIYHHNSVWHKVELSASWLWWCWRCRDEVNQEFFVNTGLIHMAACMKRCNRGRTGTQGLKECWLTCLLFP